ncbi:GTPase HflX [Thalassobaculum fulvum]|uniref:GTPase HflX n=1 Tax=Thalassobaculum fulvum TaxID=1633335 RepID=A0A919CNY1_9PROT|nr:GTPase HflX [Thalassobaculum fulvum]GHD47390.1 GTPase HflX [Thalassobaculum fulvum]
MGTRALVVHPRLKTEEETGEGVRDPEARLEEAVGLTSAIDLITVHSEVVAVARPRPGSLLGSGQIERLAQLVEAMEIEVVVVDRPLTPVQQRNLEKALKAKVLDRTQLILEIFGARARTHEGRLQVDLASLTFQRSRLVRSWTHLERQRGGTGFMGGPGESQLEIDRRLIGDRITKIRRELEEVKRTRELHRGARKRVPYPIVALVGYTNAGKSTLFNRLSGASVMAEDLLFATLDPTMRRIGLPGGRTIILSDTVGFISELPTHLVAAFRATLEEVTEADVVVHVRDIAHPDTAAQKADVLGVLADLGIDETTRPGRMLEVLNKIDRLPDDQRIALKQRTEAGNEPVVAVSAVTGEGIDRLTAAIAQLLGVDDRLCGFVLDLSDGAAVAWLYAHGDVVERSDDAEGTTAVKVRLSAADAARFEKRFAGAIRRPAD